MYILYVLQLHPLAILIVDRFIGKNLPGSAGDKRLFCYLITSLLVI